MTAAKVLTREFPPDPGDRAQRLNFVVSLMIEQRWERGVTGNKLAEEWGLERVTMREIAAEASRYLKLLGSRDAVLDIVRVNAHLRLRHAEDPAFVALSRLLIDSVGGFAQRHEVKVDLGGKSEQELFTLMLAEIRQDPELRAQAIAFLTAEVPLLPEGQSDGESD